MSITLFGDCWVHQWCIIFNVNKCIGTCMKSSDSRGNHFCSTTCDMQTKNEQKRPLQHFLLISLLIFLRAAHVDCKLQLWTPLSTNEQLFPAFSKILYPVDIVTFELPVYGDRTLWIPSYNSDYADLCSLGDTFFNSTRIDCFTYFSNANYALADKISNKTMYAHLNNYCNYCVTSGGR